jgi:hypothetical protein
MTETNAPSEMPELRYPRIMLTVTENIEPKDPLVTWKVGTAHPFVPNMKIVSIFINGGFVEIYSATGSQAGMRDLIPISFLRLSREAMPFDVFVEELLDAELRSDEDEEDEEEDEDTEPDLTPPPPPESSTNGRVTS